ncbi:MAG: ribulose-phosphate 3-epimerase [Eubacteriales bacterium]|nr:ribulose-phosphate 3-epimerase [Eubacteriales bacterium]
MNQSVWNEKRIVSPSLICLDLCDLKQQIGQLERAGCKLLHVDILDGHFSPSMPLGLETVRQLRKITELPFDAHVMTTANQYFVDELLDIGTQQIVFHAETEPHVDGMLKHIHAKGARAGLALKPATPLNTLEYALELCDAVLLMLINPGYASSAGEKQVPYAERKIHELRSMIDARGLPTLIELDGRVSPQNIREYAGHANIFVAGTTCLKRNDLEATFRAANAL